MKTKSKPKQFLNLFGDPIIVHTLRRFEACQKIDKIIVVMLRSYISYMNDIVEKYGLQKVTSVVPGGKTGQQSIFNGISEAKRLFGTEGNIVLIHDGVRPCFEDDLIDRCIEAVKKYGSAISCVPATETTTQVDIENSEIKGIVDRDSCYLARAPQCFRLGDLYRWHMKAQEANDYSVVDSCSMMLSYGDGVPHVVKTIPENIKVTTPIDYYIIRAVIEARDELTVPEI